MRKKILNHTCFLIVFSVLLTFLAAGLVMYGKYNEDLKESVRDSTKYIQDGVEKMGNSYLDEALGQATSARITLLDPKGNVLFDSLEDSAELENHSNRPEFIQAEKKWICGITAIFRNPVQTEFLLCGKAGRRGYPSCRKNNGQCLFHDAVEFSASWRAADCDPCSCICAGPQADT